MFRVLVLLVAFAGVIQSANILGLLGVPVISHFQFNTGILHELAKRGHNVTVLSIDLPKPNQEIPPNVHYIHLENVYPYLYKEGDKDAINIDKFVGKIGFPGLHVYNWWAGKVGGGIVSSKGFQQLLDYPDDFKFDLVLNEYTIGPYLLGFVAKFSYPPIVGLTPFLNPPKTADSVGSHLFPGYIPHWSTDYDVQMNFFERIHNFCIQVYEIYFHRYIHTPKIDALMRPYFPAHTPNLRELEQRTVLALVNSDPVINYPESIPPNVIEVGGLQITEPGVPPKDINDFMNASKQGVIFFSFGTNMYAENMGEKRLNIILNVMASLPQYNFLWKMNFDQSKYKIPKNVIVRSFFNQKDILAHLKTKAFVTHAGGFSTQESVWFGVPMLGLALFVDQARNLRRSVENGVSTELDFYKFTEESLRESILNVAENKTLRETTLERSRLYRDQPLKPLEKAVWWVEYVLRHPNTTHLRSPTLDICFFAAHSLDVIFFFVFVIFAAIFVVFKAVCFVFGSKSKSVKKVKSQKKEQ